MRWLIVVTAGLAGLMLGGCEEMVAFDAAPAEHRQANSGGAPAAGPEAALPPPAGVGILPPADLAPSDPAGRSAAGASLAPPDIRAAELADQRVVVYTADYTVAVANPDPAMNEVEKLADELGGYLQSRGVDRITIRVPAAKFKAATERIDRLGQLLSRAVQAQDITEQYVDLKSRLAASQTLLKQLQALLEKAADARVALEIQTEIGRTMTEVERLTGQIRLLENRVALSTITVTFRRLAEAPRSTLLARKLPFNWLHTLGVSRLLDY